MVGVLDFVEVLSGYVKGIDVEECDCDWHNNQVVDTLDTAVEDTGIAAGIVVGIGTVVLVVPKGPGLVLVLVWEQGLV